MFEEPIMEDMILRYSEENEIKKLEFIQGTLPPIERRFPINEGLFDNKSTSTFIREYLKLIEKELPRKIDAKEFVVAFKDAYNNIQRREKEYKIKLQEQASLNKKVEEEEAEKDNQKYAIEFEDFIHENNMTIFDFISWVSMWSLANEEANFTMGLLAAMSTMLKIKPVWFMPVGESSKGKTFLLQAVQSMLPEDFIVSGRISEAALYRSTLETGDPAMFDGKWIDFGDLGGENSMDKWRNTFDVFKQLSTDGYCDTSITSDVKDPQTGEKGRLHLQLEGHPACIFTSVHQENNEEQYQNRGFEVTPHSKDEDVKEFELRVRPGKASADYIETTINPIKNCFKHWLKHKAHEMEHIEIINPYEKSLATWASSSNNVRRELNTFSLMVGIVARFNQDPSNPNKQMITDTSGRKYIVATKEDNLIVTNIFNPSSNISPLAKDVFNQLVKKIRPFDEDELHDFNDPRSTVNIKNVKSMFSVPSLQRRQLKRKSPEFKDKLWDIIRMLNREGYIEEVPTDNKEKIYRLNTMEPITHIPINLNSETIKDEVEDYILGPWGYSIDPEEFYNIFNNEEEIKSRSYGNLKIPPWLNVKGEKDVEIDNSVEQQTF